MKGGQSARLTDVLSRDRDTQYNDGMYRTGGFDQEEVQEPGNREMGKSSKVDTEGFSEYIE